VDLELKERNVDQPERLGWKKSKNWSHAQDVEDWQETGGVHSPTGRAVMAACLVGCFSHPMRIARTRVLGDRVYYGPLNPGLSGMRKEDSFEGKAV
jgi:hypothetical protein